MKWIALLFSGRSGKPCLTKVTTFLWINTVIILMAYLTFHNNEFPKGIPDAVYYSVALVLGVKTFGDVKLSSPQAPVPPVPVPPLSPVSPLPPV